MSSPAAKRLRTNTIGDAQATQAEIPSATSQATATSSQATAEKAKDLFEQLEKKEIRRLLIDAAKAHPDVLLGMEDSIKAAIEREKARVINFDHHSKNVWWSINCEHSSKRGSAQYEMAYDVAQGVEDTIVSIVIECGPNSSFGTRVNGLSVLRKIGKTIALSEGDTIAHEVKNSFQSNTVLTRGMMKILNTMERSELDSILKSDLYEKLVDLDELSDGYCLFEGLAEVLSKILGEDGKKQEEPEKCGEGEPEVIVLE